MSKLVRGLTNVSISEKAPAVEVAATSRMVGMGLGARGAAMSDGEQAVAHVMHYL